MAKLVIHIVRPHLDDDVTYTSQEKQQQQQQKQQQQKQKQQQQQRKGRLVSEELFQVIET